MRPTPRQIEVLELLREGLSFKEVAALLSISPNTVRLFTVEIRYRLGTLNTIHSVVVAIRRGYISLGGDTVVESVGEHLSFCVVCKHRVYNLEKHQLTEEHRRNERRLFESPEERLK